ncbi:MAG TPA: hypothetical protein VM686_18610, partial [Polyangiaceae bacterium]|nr:hypothetical protein [Polyangiaceae bacterium]
KLSIDVSHFDRRIEREALARLLLDIGARDPAAIRSAARSCYSEFFGIPLPERAERRVSDHPKWRH